jgi:hypothetical protein
MQRIRTFSPEGDGYKYKKTVYLPDADITKTGEALVTAHGVEVGDVAYWGDFFLRLDKTEDGVLRWTQLLADRPELRGLYAQAVEAEQPVGDPWQ